MTSYVVIAKESFQEVGKANSHIRFAVEDSDLSEYCDFVGNLHEE